MDAPKAKLRRGPYRSHAVDRKKKVPRTTQWRSKNHKNKEQDITDVCGEYTVYMYIQGGT